MITGRRNPHRGVPRSPECRAKISKATKGENNPNYGKKATPETRLKQSLSHIGNKSHLGIKHTPETIARMSAIKTGKKLSAETRAKISASHVGRKFSPETRAKLSLSNRGENGSNWQGGISFEPYCPKFNPDLKRRIRAFFDHRCIICGKTTEENKQNMGCHHVNYNKSACCDGKPVRFAALCLKCHGKTNHEQERWEAMLHRIIDEIYDGRSYFTKDEWIARGMA